MDNYFDKTTEIFDFLVEELDYEVFESRSKPSGFYLTYANTNVGFRIDVEVFRGFSLVFTVFMLDDCKQGKNIGGEDIGHYPDVTHHMDTWFYLGELLERHIEGFNKLQITSWGKSNAEAVLKSAAKLTKEHHELIFDSTKW